LIVFLLFGLSVRTAVVLTPGAGHDADQQLFVIWARNLQTHGFGDFYSMTSFCNYPPLMLLILWFLGHAAALFDGVLANDALMRMLVKVPANVADVAIAVVLYRHGRRLFSPSAALAAAAIYFFNPVSIYVSAYWGQVDSIHSLLLLLSLVVLQHRRWTLAGSFTALAVLQKLQSASVLPLILLEVFRLARRRGLSRWALGCAIAILPVCAPFFTAGVLDTALRHGYIDVIGQYKDLSLNAYNLWYLIATPSAADTSVPPAIARIVAGGRTHFSEVESWLLWFTWRTISLILYLLFVAVILGLYSLRPGAVARFGAAATLGLAFFMIPTEMHERYALPVLALAPLWAVAGAWRERIYFLVSALLALNLAAVIPAEEFAGGIAAMMLFCFLALIAGLGVAASAPSLQPASAADPMLPLSTDDATASPVIALFRRATCLSLATATTLAVYILFRALLATPIQSSPDVLFLGDIKPLSAVQGWGRLRTDRAVTGSLLRLGETYYLRGLGTHAPGNIRYRLPPGFDRFRAMVGIDRATGGRGTVEVFVEVDGDIRFQSGPIHGGDGPHDVSVPIAGAQELVLRAEPGREGAFHDHVDWALARLERIGDHGSNAQGPPPSRPQ
jgi:Gpi18-like mannosyltransferase